MENSTHSKYGVFFYSTQNVIVYLTRQTPYYIFCHETFNYELVDNSDVYTFLFLLSNKHKQQICRKRRRPIGMSRSGRLRNWSKVLKWLEGKMFFYYKIFCYGFYFHIIKSYRLVCLALYKLMQSSRMSFFVSKNKHFTMYVNEFYFFHAYSDLFVMTKYYDQWRSNVTQIIV